MLIRKISVIAIVLVFALFGCAFSESGALPPDEVFEEAKTALACMSQRDYAGAIRALNAQSWLSEKNLRQNIDANCRHLYDVFVQDQYAVAWLSGTGLYLAVPVEEPSDGYADVIVYLLSNRFEFTALRFFKWSDVERELKTTSYIKWLDEYRPSYSVFPD